jgi:hypothetical protein
MLPIGLDQSPGDGVPESAGLPCLASAAHMGLHVKGTESVGCSERLLNVLNQGRTREVIT